jgi:hypothetical protein
MHYTTETFFRPPEVERQRWTLAAEIYNRCQLLLGRSRTGCVFVPLRGMQYLAVIDRQEIIFVDGQGGYGFRDGHGGRLIRLAWRPAPPRQRHSIVEPVPCELVYYGAGLRDLQRRLVGELIQALRQLEKKHRAATLPIRGAKILPLEVRRQ